MSIFWDERMETAVTGFEETWSPGITVGAGSSVAMFTITPPTFPYWAAQGLLITAAAASNAFIRHTFSAKPNVFISLDSAIGAETLSDNNFCGMCIGTDGSANALWAILLRQTAGLLYSEFYVYHNASANLINGQMLWGLSWPRRFELNWNNTADTWQVWVDSNSIGSGTLTGAANARDFTDIYVGNVGTTNQSAAIAYDLIILDDAARSNPGYGITQRNLGVSKLAGVGGLAH